LCGGAGRAAINIYFLPTGPTAANPPHTAAAGEWNKQTDRQTTGAVPANQPVSGGEATDRRKSFRRKMADCPS